MRLHPSTWKRYATLALLVIGCGASHGRPDADSSDGGDAGPDPTLDGGAGPTLPAFIEAYASVLCDHWLDCEPYWRFADGYLQLIACHPSLNLEFYRDVLDGYRRGTVRYDPAVAEDCLAALSSRLIESCVYLDLGAPCLPYAGTIELGGACLEDVECEPALWCDFDMECPGRCVMRPREGDGCSTAFEALASCGTGLLDCIVGACRPLGDVSEPCADVPCQFDLVCDPGTLLCRRWTVGDTCREGIFDCQSDLVCASATDGWVCSEPVGIGDRCDDASPCPRHSTCVGGQCQYIAPPGGLCGLGVAVCPLGFACTDAACRPLPVAGQPCVDECATGECTDGTCSFRPPGASCDVGQRLLTQCEVFCTPEGCARFSSLGELCPICEDGLSCRRDSAGRLFCVPDCASTR